MDYLEEIQLAKDSEPPVAGLLEGELTRGSVALEEASDLGARTEVASPRISQVLFDSPRRNFGSFAALPSNVQAIDSALMFAANLHPFAAIVGPSGWGKTHLLEAVVTRLSLERDTVPQVLMATEWALGSVRFDPHQPVLLDNAQEALAQNRASQAMRISLERRVKSGRPTFLCFTSSKGAKVLRGLLPQPRSWSVACISAPEPMERILILEQMARQECMQLSNHLLRIIAFRMQGNGRTLIGALKRLKLYGSHWMDGWATLKACGILNPFLRDDADWDLVDAIARASARLATGSGGVDIALFLLLRQANLTEVDVARRFGIEPGEAYNRAIRTEKAVATEASLRQLTLQIVEGSIGELLTF